MLGFISNFSDKETFVKGGRLVSIIAGQSTVGATGIFETENQKE